MKTNSSIVYKFRYLYQLDEIIGPMNVHDVYVICTSSEYKSNLFYRSSSLGMLDLGASYGLGRLGTSGCTSTFLYFFIRINISYTSYSFTIPTKTAYNNSPTHISILFT